MLGQAQQFLREDASVDPSRYLLLRADVARMPFATGSGAGAAAAAAPGPALVHLHRVPAGLLPLGTGGHSHCSLASCFNKVLEAAGWHC
jgi:hypothetical protein